MMEVFRVDVHRTAEPKPYNACERLAFVPPSRRVGGVPSVFVLHMLMPDYAQPKLSTRREGPGFCITAFAQMTPETRAAFESGELSNAHKLMRTYLLARCQWNESRARSNSKMIVLCPNLDTCSAFNVVTRRLGKIGHAKPFICNKSATFFDSPAVVECDINVHNFRKMALRGLGTVKKHLRRLFLDIGLVLEGEGNAELPERMMLAFRMSQLDLASVTHSI